MERAFAKVYAQTGDATYSAAKAGSRNPVLTGRDLAARPAVKQTAIDMARDMIGARIPKLSPIIDDLIQEASERKASFKDRARFVVDMIKLNQAHHVGLVGAGKDMHEMTAAELHEESERLRRQLELMQLRQSDMATVIDGAEIPEDDEDSRLPPDPFV